MPPRLAISEPYAGPRPFEKREREIFFGRDEETSDLRDLCMSYQLVVLYSQSGAGKSSLVRAGLRPKLVQQRVRLLPVARVSGAAAVQGAGTNRNVYVRNALLTLFGARADPAKTLTENLRAHIPRGDGARRRVRAIIFDQFEELFTAYPDRWREREGFFSQLKEALRSDSKLRMILVMREERLAELDTYCDLVPTNFRIRYRLERLKEDAALLAIQKPPQRFGWKIGDGDAHNLVANLRQIRIRAGSRIKQAEGEYVEPVHLQVVCKDIWQQRDEKQTDKLLRVPHNVQDIDRALSDYYDSALRKAAVEGKTRERRIREWVERELITPRGTRGFVYKDDKATEGLPNTALEILEREHIVRSEPRAGESWYELTHDRLIPPVINSNRVWRQKQQRSSLPRYTVGLVLLGLGISLVIPHLKHVLEQLQRNEDAKLATQDYLKAEGIALEASEAVQSGKAAAGERKWKEAIKLYSSAETRYERAGSPVQAAFYLHKGGALMHLFDYDGSRQAYERDIQIALEAYRRAAKDPEWNFGKKITAGNNLGADAARDELWRDCLALGQVLFKSGETSRAIERFNDALTVTADDEGGIARVENLLGDAYLRKGDFENAEQHYSEAITHITTFQGSFDAFIDALDLAITKSQKGEYREGLKLYQNMWGIAGIARLEKLSPARLWREIAYDELHLGKCTDAFDHLNQSKRLATRQKDIMQQGYVSLGFAEYYLECDGKAPAGKDGIWNADGKKFSERAAVSVETPFLRSQEAADDAIKQFGLIHDPTMIGAAYTYLGRVDIALAEIHKKEGLKKASSEFEKAHEDLKRALDPQDKAERNTGVAFTWQAYGMLAEAEEKSDSAKEDYEKAYCIYRKMKVSDQHRHFVEVKDSLRSLKVDVITVGPQCDQILASARSTHSERR